MLKLGCTIKSSSNNSPISTATLNKANSILYDYSQLEHNNIQRRIFLSFIREPLTIKNLYYIQTYISPNNSDINDLLQTYTDNNKYNLLDELLACYCNIVIDSYLVFRLVQSITDLEQRTYYNNIWHITNTINDELIANIRNPVVNISKYINYEKTVIDISRDVSIQCCVCYNDHRTNIIMQLQCPGNHPLCIPCLLAISQQASNCPMCRHVF